MKKIVMEVFAALSMITLATEVVSTEIYVFKMSVKVTLYVFKIQYLCYA